MNTNMSLSRAEVDFGIPFGINGIIRQFPIAPTTLASLGKFDSYCFLTNFRDFPYRRFQTY